MKLDGIDVTWLGHATLVFGTPEGRTILVDPWLRSSPVCPEAFYEIEPDLILASHGHSDHIGDLVEVAQRSRAPTVCIFEIARYLASKGVDNAIPMNKGGTARLEDYEVAISMTQALHSSSMEIEDGVMRYLGEPVGYVIHFSNGARFYVAGDTCLFGDMEIIRLLWEPTTAVLPIGDHFTMDPRQAAHACRLLGVGKAIPYHYGTFPVLTGTPDAFEQEILALGLDTEVVSLPIGA